MDQNPLFTGKAADAKKIINLATLQTSAGLLLKVQKLASHYSPPTTQSHLLNTAENVFSNIGHRLDITS